MTRNAVLLSILLTGCSHAKTFEVSAPMWVNCWNQCGKADRLEAVTQTDCVCKGGPRVPHGFYEPQKPLYEGLLK